MEIEKYINIVWRRKWIILVTILVTFVVVVIGTQFYSPSYEATTTLRVATSRTGQVDYEDLLYADRLLKTFAEIATGSSVEDDLVRLFGLTNVPDIAVQVLPNTELIRITVSHPNPILARDVANTVATIIMRRSQELDNRLNMISIIDPAVTPRSPTISKGIIVALGLFVGMVGGFGLAFLFEYLDRRLYTNKQIQEASELQLLGKIPQVANKQPIINGDCPQYYTDAFQILRSNIIMQNHKNVLKTLLITSADPGDGKSTIVVNLAYAMKNMNKKVIVVDADMRKPRLHTIFKIPNNLGLSNLLAEDEKNIYRTWQEINGLAVITSGPVQTDPTLLLSYEKISFLIGELEKWFDFILIDSPAFLVVPDAKLIASHVDGLLLVVNRTTTTKEKIDEVTKKLEEIQVRSLGVIINKAELNHNNYYYYQSN